MVAADGEVHRKSPFLQFDNAAGRALCPATGTCPGSTMPLNNPAGKLSWHREMKLLRQKTGTLAPPCPPSTSQTLKPPSTTGNGLRPSPDGVSLAAEVQVLAEVYARMAWQGLDEVDEHSLPPATLRCMAGLV